MKIELTDSFDKFMRESFPCLVKAEEAIYETTGITLEQMRSSSRLINYVCARAIFFHLCIKDVQRTMYLSSYLNKDHSSGAYYNSKFDSEHQHDYMYKSMFEKVKKAFENK